MNFNINETATLSVNALTKPVTEGFLKKRSQGILAWKRKLFVLNDVSLYWFKGRKEQELRDPSGTIPLDMIESVQLSTDDEAADCQFNVFCKENKHMTLRAPSSAECTRWMTAIIMCYDAQIKSSIPHNSLHSDINNMITLDTTNAKNSEMFFKMQVDVEKNIAMTPRSRQRSRRIHSAHDKNKKESKQLFSFTSSDKAGARLNFSTSHSPSSLTAIDDINTNKHEHELQAIKRTHRFTQSFSSGLFGRSNLDIIIGNHSDTDIYINTAKTSEDKKNLYNLIDKDLMENDKGIELDSFYEPLEGEREQMKDMERRGSEYEVSADIVMMDESESENSIKNEVCVSDCEASKHESETHIISQRCFSLSSKKNCSDDEDVSVASTSVELIGQNILSGVWKRQRLDRVVDDMAAQNHHSHTDEIWAVIRDSILSLYTDPSESSLLNSIRVSEVMNVKLVNNNALLLTFTDEKWKVFCAPNLQKSWFNSLTESSASKSALSLSFDEHQSVSSDEADNNNSLQKEQSGQLASVQPQQTPVTMSHTSTTVIDSNTAAVTPAKHIIQANKREMAALDSADISVSLNKQLEQQPKNIKLPMFVRCFPCFMPN